jgi:TetR/AcrR family transcriptional regulator, transcriptional repressor of bet genes
MPGKKAPESARREQILAAAFSVASHKGIDAVTVRAVAAKAKLSHGLVLFHFKRKDQLLRAVLDRLLATTSELHAAPEIARIHAPLDRLRALLRQEMDRLGHDPRGVRLFYDFWVLGTRNAAIGARIGAELERYRQAFRGIIEQVIRAEPARFAHTTPDGLAAVAVSFINGCAVQAMIDPRHFDIDQYLAAAQGLLGQLAPSAKTAA